MKETDFVPAPNNNDTIDAMENAEVGQTWKATRGVWFDNLFNFIYICNRRVIPREA